ncbi:hypothetical protein GW17_00061159 [Ensete ventricosum]|nr:hypothetical protein GW17_00061159 [Ensete ventricosum]
MQSSDYNFHVWNQVLDQKGVGQLIKVAVERGRRARPDLKVRSTKRACRMTFTISCPQSLLSAPKWSRRSTPPCSRWRWSWPCGGSLACGAGSADCRPKGILKQRSVATRANLCVSINLPDNEILEWSKHLNSQSRRELEKFEERTY